MLVLIFSRSNQEIIKSNHHDNADANSNVLTKYPPLTLSCILHFTQGNIAQLVELRSCNLVVAIMSWMSNCPSGTDSIL